MEENKNKNEDIKQTVEKETVAEREDTKAVKYEFSVNTAEAAQAITTILGNLKALKESKNELEAAQRCGELTGMTLAFVLAEVLEDEIGEALHEIITETALSTVKDMPADQLYGVRKLKTEREKGKRELIGDIKKSMEELPKEARTWEVFYGIIAVHAAAHDGKANNEHVQEDKANCKEEQEAES